MDLEQVIEGCVRLKDRIEALEQRTPESCQTSLDEWCKSFNVSMGNVGSKLVSQRLSNHEVAEAEWHVKIEGELDKLLAAVSDLEQRHEEKLKSLALLIADLQGAK